MENSDEGAGRLADRTRRADEGLASWWTDSGLGRFELCYISDKQQHEVDFVVTKDGEPLMLTEVKSTHLKPLDEIGQGDDRAESRDREDYARSHAEKRWKMV